MFECKRTDVPSWAKSSKSYADMFNKVSAELDTGIKFTGDNPGGCTNYPDAELSEVEVSPEARAKYGLDGANPVRSTPQLELAIDRVAKTLEEHRQKVAKLSWEQLTVVPLATLLPEGGLKVNPAERAWLEKAKAPLVRTSLEIFARQSLPDFEDMEEWMRNNGDTFSKVHFLRMRQLFFPTMKGKAKDLAGFADAGAYANPFPWYPNGATYNAMFPRDLTPDELKYINDNYNLEDPIRQVYTVVERISAGEAKSISSNPRKNSNGEVVEWARKGLGDTWYHVTNMVWHSRYREYFLQMANTLKSSADIEVGGATLDPQFKAYTLQMAHAFEEGDFTALLKADLDQTNGNLFLSIFQHEGYWADGVKFPLMLEIGVRDAESTAKVIGNGDVFQWLERDVASEIHRYIPAYESRLMRPADIQKSAALIWVTAYGGFMRAYQGDPGGHDYPKRPYPGITAHKTVVALDVMRSWTPVLIRFVSDLLGPEDAKHVTFGGTSTFSTWHEGAHGTGNRESSKTTSGRTMSEVFGKLWGLQAEPYGDTGAFLMLDRLHRTITQAEYNDEVKSAKAALKSGVINKQEYDKVLKMLAGWRKTPRISDQEYQEGVTSGLSMELKRVWPKAAALNPAYQEEDPHGVGSNVMIGWLCKNGVAKLGDKGHVEIDWPKFIPAVRAMRNKLVEYASTDNIEGFKKWCAENINAVPDAMEARIQAVKKDTATFVIVDREGIPTPANPESM